MRTAEAILPPSRSSSTPRSKLEPAVPLHTEDPGHDRHRRAPSLHTAAADARTDDRPDRPIHPSTGPGRWRRNAALGGHTHRPSVSVSRQRFLRVRDTYAMCPRRDAFGAGISLVHPNSCPWVYLYFSSVPTEVSRNTVDTHSHSVHYNTVFIAYSYLLVISPPLLQTE